MTARTLEDLSDLVADDLIWRKKEMTAVTNLFARASRGTKNALLRSFVALLYAHWEGFIRNTTQRYLEFVAVRRLSYSALTSNFVALSIHKRLREAVSQRNLTATIELVDLLRAGMGSRSRIPYREGIHTESNLSSSVLRSIMVTLGLDYTSFETKAQLIDERLLSVRNDIAHGEYLLIDEGAALELAAEVRQMMEHFRDLVENAVVTGQYKYVA